MPLTHPSLSHNLTLDAVIDRLSQHPAVDGLLLIGSAAGDHFSSESDYDLLLVLNEMPASFHVALTTIDQRLTDIIFTTLQGINALITRNHPIPVNSHEGKLIRWLQHGTIHHDRTGRLHIAQKMLTLGEWLEDAGTSRQIYERWANTNYNIQHNRRLLAAADPVYHAAVDLRHLYQLSQLWSDYFLVRHIPDSGEKALIRLLQRDDPDFLEAFQRLLSTSDRQPKQTQYEQLAALVFAPFAPPWEEPVTSITFHSNSPWSPTLLKQALSFWDSLLTSD